MNRKMMAAILAGAVLFSTGGGIGVQASSDWFDVLDTVLEAASAHQARQAQKGPKLPKVDENNITDIGEMVMAYGPRMLSGRPGTDLELSTDTGIVFLFHAEDGYFTLQSQDHSKTYYTSEKAKYDTGRFQIREIGTSAKDTKLWAVVYDCNGNSRCQYGFWLFGIRDNYPVTYITPSMMAQLGMALPDTDNGNTYKGPHRLDFVANGDGTLTGYYNYQFWPPDVSHAGVWTVLDKQFTISWNKKHQKFEISNIQQKDQRLDGTGVNAFEAGLNWRDLTEEEKAYYENGLRAIRAEHGGPKSQVDKLYDLYTGYSR